MYDITHKRLIIKIALSSRSMYFKFNILQELIMFFVFMPALPIFVSFIVPVLPTLASIVVPAFKPDLFWVVSPWQVFPGSALFVRVEPAVVLGIIVIAALIVVWFLFQHYNRGKRRDHDYAGTPASGRHYHARSKYNKSREQDCRSQHSVNTFSHFYLLCGQRLLISAI